MSKIFLGILTAHHDSRKPYRWRARETFLKEWPEGDYRFYFGQTKAFPAEDSSFPDSVVIDAPDAKEYMVLKNQAMFRHALENGYDYCFRVCDDTYVNPRNLFKAGLEKYDYAGMMPCKLAILGSMKIPMRHFDYMHGGCGIWLSRRAMEKLVNDEWIGPSLPESWPEEVEIGFGLHTRMSRTYWDDHWIGEVLKGNLPYNDPLREQVSEAYHAQGINIFEDNIVFLNDTPEQYVAVHDPGVTKLQDSRWESVMEQVRRINGQ